MTLELIQHDQETETETQTWTDKLYETNWGMALYVLSSFMLWSALAYIALLMWPH